MATQNLRDATPSNVALSGAPPTAFQLNHKRNRRVLSSKSSALSEVLRPQTRPASNSGQHPWTDLLAIVKGENKVGPSGASQNPMGSSGLPLDLPADPQQGRQDQPGLPRAPLAHAATENTSTNSGIASPCSRRSAITRNAKAFTFAKASSCVCP